MRITSRLIKPLAATALLVVSLCYATGQGSLDPPAGPPAPNMKTLQEIWDRLGDVSTSLAGVDSDVASVQSSIGDVEADLAGVEADIAGIESDIAGIVTDHRTPITSLPISIGTSGSYYLTGNIEYSGLGSTPAIEITAPNVTIDLCGFTLSSTSSVTAPAISVIASGSSSPHTTIKKGSITGATTVSNIGATWDVAPGGFSIGVSLSGNAAKTRLIDMSVSGCRTTGITLGSASSATRCQSFRNGGAGFHTTSGSILDSCSAQENGGNGFQLNVSTAEKCTSRANGGDGFSVNSGILSHCHAISNNLVGIDFDSTGGVLAFSRASVNGGVEIVAGASVNRTGNVPTP